LNPIKKTSENYKRHSSMKILTMYIHKQMIAAIDELVDTGIVVSRSEYMRAAIFDRLKTDSVLLDILKVETSKPQDPNPTRPCHYNPRNSVEFITPKLEATLTEMGYRLKEA